MITKERLTRLKELEAKSIHILREVAAEFTNPVMMYSEGKGSSVMFQPTNESFTLGNPS